MENQDKIFEQLKDVAQKAESKEFPSMEKVWSRVEEKLDHKAVATSVGNWKKLAIAASVLLLLTLSYQFFKPDPKTAPVVIPEPQIVIVAPNNPAATEKPEQPIAATEDTFKADSEADNSREYDAGAQNIPAHNHIISVRTEGAVSQAAEKPSAPSSQIRIPAASIADLQTITGVVSDKTGSLPGANVVVMGTTRVTQTDMDGKYTIEAKKGDQLVFSFVGMKEFVATVGDRNQINAQLPQGEALLESAIIDVGHDYDGFSNPRRTKSQNYGKLPASPKKDKSRKAKSPYNGKADAENTDTEVSARANVGFGSNSPTLYIIDGKPATEEQFKQLKAEDIASMKLMTESEASSFYGNKAINGALIVSKKAAKNDDAMYRNSDEPFTENLFESPITAPLSTFSVDVANTSYTSIRKLITNGKKVPAEAVKIEEMINFFKYSYPQPEDQNPFSISTEYASCPWNSKHRLIKIGLQGKTSSSKNIAEDVKIQIEFNPMHVQSYRLIGYENRRPRPEDFNKDTDNPSVLPSGHTVTALYEVIPFGVESQYFSEPPGLKYTKIETGTTFIGELATIKFRYKKPEGGKSIEMVKTIENKPTLLKDSSDEFRFCASVAWFGLRLRDSRLIGNKSYDDLLKLAKGSLSNDPEGYKAEFVRLVELVK